MSRVERERRGHDCDARARQRGELREDTAVHVLPIREPRAPRGVVDDERSRRCVVDVVALGLARAEVGNLSRWSVVVGVPRARGTVPRAVVPPARHDPDARERDEEENAEECYTADARAVVLVPVPGVPVVPVPPPPAVVAAEQRRRRRDAPVGVSPPGRHRSELTPSPPRRLVTPHKCWLEVEGVESNFTRSRSDLLVGRPFWGAALPKFGRTEKTPR